MSKKKKSSLHTEVNPHHLHIRNSPQIWVVRGEKNTAVTFYLAEHSLTLPISMSKDLHPVLFNWTNLGSEGI